MQYIVILSGSSKFIQYIAEEIDNSEQLIHHQFLHLLPLVSRGHLGRDVFSYICTKYVTLSSMGDFPDP